MRTYHTTVQLLLLVVHLNVRNIRQKYGVSMLPSSGAKKSYYFLTDLVIIHSDWLIFLNSEIQLQELRPLTKFKPTIIFKNFNPQQRFFEIYSFIWENSYRVTFQWKSKIDGCEFVATFPEYWQSLSTKK